MIAALEQQREYPGPDGARLRYRRTGEGGRPVLFLHGFALGSVVWQRQLATLPAHGIDVIALDLRGHGGSADVAALPRGSERFVEHLNRTGRVTTTEAIELLGVSRPTAIRHLQHLVDAGLLEAVRKSPNDPRGYWRTVVEGSWLL